MKTRFKLVLLSGAMALALTGLCAATASASAASAASAPVKEMTAANYAKNHKMAVQVFVSFKEGLKKPAVATAMGTIQADLLKLPALEKAYISAKAAADEVAAKTAGDAYEQSVKEIVDLALPMDQEVEPTLRGYLHNFDRLGKVGDRLKAEPDVAALLSEVQILMKPLDDANEQVGPLQSRAANNAEKRFGHERKVILAEELAKAALEDLRSPPGGEAAQPKP
jgi:hypothetical protein